MSLDKNIMEEDEACSFAMTIASGSVLSMVLKTMIELDVLEIIKRAGPGAYVSPAEIAAQMPANENPDAANMLDRMLRLLASYSVLSYSLRTLPDGRVERLYGLAPVCKFLTNNEDEVNLGALCLLNQDKASMQSWYHLKDAILKGGNAFQRRYDKSVFEHQVSDPHFNKVFHFAMMSFSTITMKKILENYKGLQGVSTLVDIGGGTGASLSMIISKYPSIKGINFDLPHVIKEAPSLSGVKHVGGDMFVSVPSGDAMFMKNVCHNWSDEQCLMFFKNCLVALPDHGKLIVCDFILPVAPEDSHATKVVFQMDLIMMTNLGGHERTEQEFRSLAKLAGFEYFKVACSAYDVKVMEFLKKH